MTEVEQYMPTLAVGGHTQDSGKACVMEYVSVLAGERWSDTPSCTHPWIAAYARALNDNFYDADRQRLINVIPRLLIANYPSGWSCEQRKQGNRALMSYINESRRSHRSIFAMLGIGGQPGWLTSFSATAAIHGNPMRQIEELEQLLDEFDRILGRAGHPESVVTPERYDRAVRKVEGLPMPEEEVRHGKFVYAIKAVTNHFTKWEKFAYASGWVAPPMGVKPVVDTKYTVSTGEFEKV